MKKVKNNMPITKTKILNIKDIERVIIDNRKRIIWKKLRYNNPKDAKVGLIKIFDDYDEAMYIVFLDICGNMQCGVELFGDETVYIFSKTISDSLAFKYTSDFVEDCTPFLRYVMDAVSFYDTQCAQLHNEKVLYKIADKVNALERLND